MKILVIHYKSKITGGPELYFHSVIEELSLRGHDVVPFSYNWLNEEYNPSWPGKGTESFSFRDSNTAGAIKTLRRIPKMVNNRLVADDLARILLKEKPDVALVLLFLGKLSPSIFDSLCRFNVPYYVRISDFSSICATSTLFNNDICTRCVDRGPFQGVINNCSGKLSSSLLHYIIRLTLNSSKYRFAKGFLVPSKNSIDLLSKATSYSDSDLIHLPTFSPVELSFLPELSKEKRVVAYWGRVSPEKNVKELAVWMVNQAAVHPDWTYRIVGFDNSSYSSETRAVFNGMLNCECYQFAPLADCIELFTETTFFVSSTLIFDNFPQSPLVALALGVKVILPDFGSYRDVITNDNMGFLYTNLEELDFIYTAYEYDRNLVRKLYFDNFGKSKHFQTLERILCQK